MTVLLKRPLLSIESVVGKTRPSNNTLLSFVLVTLTNVVRYLKALYCGDLGLILKAKESIESTSLVILADSNFTLFMFSE
ncbi:protein of unknown function [Latilactobacillus sakei]|nr:protein of unknown function [Latilactobacillus sakei]